MNESQIVAAAARELRWFDKSARTEENAKIELEKALRFSGDKNAVSYIRNNFTTYVKAVITKANY